MANFPPYQMPQTYQPPMYQAAYQQPAYQPAQQAQSGLSGRMVTSREEALGVPVDFMGGLMIFPDVSHGAIYTKLFNSQTGQIDALKTRRRAQKEAAENE